LLLQKTQFVISWGFLRRARLAAGLPRPAAGGCYGQLLYRRDPAGPSFQLAESCGGRWLTRAQDAPTGSTDR